jgi:hypothetical protein
LNKLPAWRDLFGKSLEDKRQRDIELILRFFALFYDAKDYKRPMKDFLSDFMHAKRNMPANEVEEYRALFMKTSALARQHLGAKPFRIKSGLSDCPISQLKQPVDTETRHPCLWAPSD